MREIKKNKKIFFRTVYLSSVIMFCIMLGFLGIAKAYENIRLIGFGEYRSAIEYKNGVLNIFDYKIEIKK